MKFGTKGLDAPVIIGIILAVVAAAIILYILWSKGMLPFVSGATEAECTAYFIRGCQEAQDRDPTIFDFDAVKKVACRNFGMSRYKDKGYETCFPTLGGGGEATACEIFCNAVLGG